MTAVGTDCLDEPTLVAFFEGVLAGPRRAAVDAHIDRCAACLAIVAAVGRSDSAEHPGDPERYELRREVGAGGMGQVFEAFDRVLGRQVAIKCVRSGPEDQVAAQRFEREMALTARLQHPSIVPVYDAGLFPDGSRYFAMRLVQGQTLDAAIDEASTVQARLALVPSIRRACEAVAYAHEQSVVHRDLKPANVLIGPFGETVVLDWGLAKRVFDDEPEGDSHDPDLDEDERMTRPGAVMGTPGYIAPEVSRGEPAGMHSDVFALGKILEKLVPPAQGDDTKREILADFGAIVRRATTAEVVARYANAGELCDDLRRFEAGQTVSARDYSLRSRARRFARRHRRPILLSLAFVGVGVVVGLGVASAIQSAGPEPCSGAQEALAGTWDDARREEISKAFASTDERYAPLALSRTTRALDAYARDWAAMHTTSCEATVRGEQSSEMLDLRMACLQRALVALDASVDVLADADAEVVGKADELTRGLRALDRCASAAALGASVESPSNEDAAGVQGARASLARADALRRTAQFDTAAQSLAAARELLAGVGYEPVQTELALADGLLLETRGEYEAAEVALTEALRSGTRWGQREQMREAALGLMFVVGVRQVKAGEGLRYRPLAEGLSMGSPSAEADFYNRLGGVLYTNGDYAESAAQHRAAVAIWERLGDRVGLAAARNNYAIVLRELGEFETAETALRATLQDRLDTLGPDHPTTAEARANLALSLTALGRPADGENEARAALDIHLRTLRAEHFGIVSTRITLGRALGAQGKNEEAIAQYRAALEQLEPDHPHVVTLRHNLGSILASQRKFGQAEAEFRAALELHNKTWGANHPRQVSIRIGLAAVLVYQERFVAAEEQFRSVLHSEDRAPESNPLQVASARVGLSQALFGQAKQIEGLAELRSALRLYGSALAPDHPLVAATQFNLGEALLNDGRLDEAHPLLETAWVRRQADDIPPSSRASTAFLLAKVLWQVDRRQRPRARTLAQYARESFDEAGDSHSAAARSVEAWLTEHDNR